MKNIYKLLAGTIKNQTAKNILIMFIFTSAVNILNFVYHIVMGRMLGPSEYSTLALFISIFIISVTIISTFQTAAAKYSSIYFTENNDSKIRYLFLEITKSVAIATGVLFIIILIFIKRIQFFLKIESITQIILLAFMIVIGAQLYIGRGILQGVKKFGHLGLNQVLENGLKLLIGILFVYLGFKSIGAIAGFLMALIVSFLFIFWPIKDILRKKKMLDKNDLNDENKIDIKAFYRNMLLMLAITVAFAFISYSDIILVKHFFSSTDTGYYSASIQIGKIILFFPMAIGLVVLPRLSEKIVKKEKLLGIMLKGLLLIALLSSIILVLYYFFPQTIVKLIYGIQYLPAAGLIFKYGLFMALVSLINLEIYYFIATDRFIYLIILIIILIEQLTIIFIFHSSLIIIIWILLLNALVLFLIGLLLIFYFEKKRA